MNFWYGKILYDVVKIYNITCFPCKEGYDLFIPDLAVNLNCEWKRFENLEYGGCTVFGKYAEKYCNQEIMDLTCKKLHF